MTPTPNAPHASPSPPVAFALNARNLRKVYKRGAEQIVAVDDVSLTISKGEFVSFIGPSGSGKTTLINILGCLDNATSGSLEIGGRTVFSAAKCLSESDLTKIRRQVFGYIFQKFYLVPTLTVYENVILPFAFFKKAEAEADPMGILKFLGLDKRIDHRPSELSGGEMQRVAIGEILKNLNEKEGLTVLLVTHNPSLARIAGRTISLIDGRIAG